MKVARFVSFEPKLRLSLDRLREENKAVALSGCRIQNNKFDSSLEIMAGRQSAVEQSPKKFKLDESSESPLLEDGCKAVPLDELRNVKANQFVTVVGKVIRVEASVEVRSKEGKPLMEQDCVIADSSATCRIVLWEAHIGKLKDGVSYRWCRVVVREYGGVKYLSLVENSEIASVDDVGDVFSKEDDVGGERSELSIVEGEVVGVLSVDEYSSCLSCRGKVKTIGTSNVSGECTICCLKVKMFRCAKSKSAKIVIASNSLSG